MKRRRFLNTIGTTSAVLLARGVGAAGTSQQPRIRVGQIGTKHAHAAGQMETLRRLSDLYDVVGVVEPDRDQRQRVSQSKAYADLPWLTAEQLLNIAGLQVVAVETGVAELLRTAQLCVDAGMHVHLDKPAGESMDDLRRLHATAQKKSLTIQMGYMLRYNPAFQFLFQCVRDGWLGAVFEMDGVMSKTVGSAERKELAKFRGGSMFELGCHLIDPLVHLMGPPDRVAGFLRKTRPSHDSLVDNALAVLEYRRATATVRSAVVEVEGDQRRQFIVCGDEGTAVIRPLEPPRLELTLAKAKAGYPRGKQLVELPRSPGRYDGAWTDLARVVRQEKKHDFSPEHDLAVQRTLLQACGYDATETRN